MRLDDDPRRGIDLADQRHHTLAEVDGGADLGVVGGGEEDGRRVLRRGSRGQPEHLVAPGVAGQQETVARHHRGSQGVVDVPGAAAQIVGVAVGALGESVAGDRAMAHADQQYVVRIAVVAPELHRPAVGHRYHVRFPGHDFIDVEAQEAVLETLGQRTQRAVVERHVAVTGDPQARVALHARNRQVLPEQLQHPLASAVVRRAQVQFRDLPQAQGKRQAGLRLGTPASACGAYRENLLQQQPAAILQALHRSQE